MQTTLSNINDAAVSELLMRYDAGIAWLEKMEPETYNPMFTKNGDVFDSELYEKGLRRLEEIERSLDEKCPQWRVVDKAKLDSVKAGTLSISDLNERETRVLFKDLAPGLIA